MTDKSGAMAIRKISEPGWKARQLVPGGVSLVQSTIVPAGVDKALGVISSVHAKEMRWDGKIWRRFGDNISGTST